METCVLSMLKNSGRLKSVDHQFCNLKQDVIDCLEECKASHEISSKVETAEAL